ncbi:FAD-binding domain-containing protein [Guyanagaster necrorhizus]|uniref:FAD-binding domain-containing protein n=1 Tax=Guyanagaster necrorhizus TaxID=856835 RepID=A0A9P7VU66_9AGAR|nr:FAD-binding domain-containing protein [Guyanagaster necrorhizus MCA 3950]KAG7446652.1 FAD-binding domain-containing protein [Guyanagaster necrorhizus MCA 3950]
MIWITLLWATLLTAVVSRPEERRGNLAVCETISRAISSTSDVYYPGELTYLRDIYHWAISSTQYSACTVEPGTAEDVGIILRILSSTQTPFAVKGGGHASNPGFSSTTGVHISMYLFSEVTYDPASETVVIGSGLIWDDVYESLAPHGVNVVGGRVTGVGVAGFILGGGFSWLTNQYGLTIDTVVAYELVKPNGEIATVTANSDADLFFALKGGLNNFGIVTRFTLRTFPQGQVWGGLITYTQDHLSEVNAVAVKFANDVTDPKAAIITTYNFLLGQPGVSQLLFYDGPTPPDGIFDDFLAIPHFSMDVKTRDFVSLVLASPSNATANLRGVFNTVSLLRYSDTLIDAIVNETTFWGARLGFDSGLFISYDVEPFRPNIFSVSDTRTDSAYPPSRSVGLLPLNLYYAWAFEISDDTFQDAIRQSAAHLYNVAVGQGQSDIVGAVVYPNYAIFDTPVESLYGSNVARMKQIKASVDPDNVMALAGGFKI